MTFPCIKVSEACTGSLEDPSELECGPHFLAVLEVVANLSASSGSQDVNTNRLAIPQVRGIRPG